MWVRKNTGDKEEFDPQKIIRTCLRAGASLETANRTAEFVSSRIKNGTTTKKILEITLAYLDKKDPLSATKYNLKEAIFRLGPDGFNFEILVSEILYSCGYLVKMPEIIQGECINHEVDIVAIKKNETYMIECKFHNKHGLITRSKDALYIQSRFLDLKDGYKAKKCAIRFTHAMLISNTRFSGDVMRFAKCKNIRLLDWKYPQNKGIRDLIEKKKLYPVTILRSGDKIIYHKLLNDGIVFCRDLVKLKSSEIVTKFKISPKKVKDIVTEAQKLIQ